MGQGVQVTRFGPPEVLATTAVSDLVPGPGEVIIAVRVADVLLLDAVIRSGLAAAWFPITPPYVPGNGVAGRVSAVGEGVDPGWAGRAVVAHTGEGGGSGGYTEQARVQAGRLVAVPDGVGLPEAAAVPARRGHRAQARGQHRHPARRTGADPGGRRWPGHPDRPARPRCRGPGHRGRELGATAFEMIADGGRFSAHGAASGGFAPIGADQAARRGVTLRGIEQVQFGPGEHERLAGQALAALAAGRIRPVIGQVFPLPRAADAHLALETRSAVGKTLLTVA